MGKVTGAIKEAAGFVQEEFNEKTNDAAAAQEGRDLRNEGRIEQGKMPKLTTPGTGHPEDPEDA